MTPLLVTTPTSIAPNFGVNLSAKLGDIELAFVSALRAVQCAQQVAAGFLQYDAHFRMLTQLAPERFALHDWQGSQLDADERLELYDQWVEHTVADIETMFGELVRQPSFWQEVKRHFANLIDGLPNDVFCKIFFSAITRNLFKTRNTLPDLEFVIDNNPLANAGKHIALRQNIHQRSLPVSIMQLLQALPIEAEWQDVTVSAEQISYQINELQRHLPLTSLESIELLDTVFYQFTRAYAIGRIAGSNWTLPITLVLTNTEAGVVIDEVLLGATELGTLFSCTRPCFHVDLDHTIDTVAYLKTLMPQRRTDELFAMLGRPGTASTPRIGN